MERINRKYAIIYVDHEGETLNLKDNYTLNEMITDYYNNSGFLQWNYYLIIPKELVESPEEIESIENNDIYTRKFVIPQDEIDINDYPLI